MVVLYKIPDISISQEMLSLFSMLCHTIFVGQVIFVRQLIVFYRVILPLFAFSIPVICPTAFFGFTGFLTDIICNIEFLTIGTLF